jgi:hypothetical protein
MDIHELTHLLIPIVKEMKQEIGILKDRISVLEG